MGVGSINAYKALKYTVEHYGGTFNQNVTIPSGDTWNLQPGVTLTFASGTSLIVNGTLNAIGNSSSSITFNRSGSSGSWGGIQFNNGSSGNLQYCNIYYATNGVYAYNSSPTIKYCTIENNNIGVYCDYYSSPVMVGNNIRYNNWYGLRCNSFSPPNLTDNGYPGSNVIRNNSVNGLNVTYNCNPNLNGYTTYGNSIFNNSSYEVVAYYNCTVNADRVYWGATYPPPGGEFYAYQSTINNSNPLQTNPNPGRSIVTNENLIIKPIGVNLGIISDYFSQAEQKQNEGKYNEAIDLYLKAFEQDKDNSLNRLSMIRMEECFTKAGRNDYLIFSNKNIKPKIKEGVENYVVALELESHQMVNAGLYKDAVNNLLTILRKYNLNVDIEKNTLFRLGAFYTQFLGDNKSSDQYFNELKQKYPDDELIGQIDVIKSMGAISNTAGQNESAFGLAKELEFETKNNTEFGISNYPNPFNPTTKISYTLPEEGKVQIKIFDALGRTVTTLLDEIVSSGKHSIEWNASKSASGIYFYGISFKGQTLYKKMLLVK